MQAGVSAGMGRFARAIFGRTLRLGGMALSMAGILLAMTPFSFAQLPSASHTISQKFVVVLDPAHGGDDAGATLKSGHAEKALTLAFSLKLRSMLGARGVQVVSTRESDVSAGAVQRAEDANHAQAQACLSIHFTDTGSGVHLFTSDLASTTTGVRFLPWKTAQSAWVNRSLALTGRLNSAFQQTGLTVSLARIALPGLDSMACPAVAIEIAPERVSGSQKVRFSQEDPKYQARVAQALAAALMVWKTEARQP